MSTTEIIDIKDALKDKEASAGNIDTSKLTDQEKILLNQEQDDDENITSNFTVPAYIENLGQTIIRTTHSIFPDATPEQLELLTNQVSTPIRNLLADIAYYNHAASHRCLELVRKEHVLQPPTRYTLDFSVNAVRALLNGVMPGYVEKIVLENSGENLDEWTRDIPEPKDIPVDGIPVRLIVNNQIYTGKLCFFSYLSENGDSHVISDIITFWATELNGFMHTFSVGYWQPIDSVTGKYRALGELVSETEGENVDVSSEATES